MTKKLEELDGIQEFVKPFKRIRVRARKFERALPNDALKKNSIFSLH